MQAAGGGGQRVAQRLPRPGQVRGDSGRFIGNRHGESARRRKRGQLARSRAVAEKDQPRGPRIRFIEAQGASFLPHPNRSVLPAGALARRFARFGQPLDDAPVGRAFRRQRNALAAAQLFQQDMINPLRTLHIFYASGSSSRWP